MRLRWWPPGSAVAARARLIAIAAALAVALASCGPTLRGGGDDAAGPPLATPMASPSTSVEAALRQLRAAISAVGYRLDPPVVTYRPSEPASLGGIPRAVLQSNIPGTGQGYVVVYDLGSEAAAEVAAGELAAHLGSGFGQTNYPSDAQFSVARLGGTVLFTWWSRERAADPEAAEAAFTALSGVGEAVPVVK